jgi:hypothetical protein
MHLPLHLLPSALVLHRTKSFFLLALRSFPSQASFLRLPVCAARAIKQPATITALALRPLLALLTSLRFMIALRLRRGIEL